MNIDERIQALVERHEALTMNLEFLTHDVADLRKSTSSLERTAESLKQTAEVDGENIRALARIAEIHERRISSLEDDAPGPRLQP